MFLDAKDMYQGVTYYFMVVDEILIRLHLSAIIGQLSGKLMDNE
jgi:hypothetical protein